MMIESAPGSPGLPAGGADAGHRLAIALQRLPPLDAVTFACGAALSFLTEHRRALAEALSWPFRLAGDDVLIDHLSRDPVWVVRQAAARAAHARWRIVGHGVLERLAGDGDPRVAEVARFALRGGAPA